MNQLIEPLDKKQKSHAQTRLDNGDKGNDGFGGITHLFSYVNDLSSNIPLLDIKFFLTELDKIGKSKAASSTPNRLEY